MNEATEILFYTPPLLRGLCYLSGMSLFVSTLFWLTRRATGRENIYTLRGISLVWLMRILAVCAFISLVLMFFSVHPISRPSHMLPEIAILLLLGAAFMISKRHENLTLLQMFVHHFPIEITKTIGVALLSVLGWGLSFGLGWIFFHAANALQSPVWVPVFFIGILWNAPLPLLYASFRRQPGHEDMKFYPLLWPILVAYLLILLPDFIDHLGRDPELHEMIHGRLYLRGA